MECKGRILLRMATALRLLALAWLVAGLVLWMTVGVVAQGSWGPMPNGTLEFLHGAWSGGPDDLFAVGAGGTVRYDPLPETGTLIVEVQASPDDTGDTFGFHGDASGTIADGGTIVVNDLDPGAYSVTQAPACGWDLDTITCDDGNSSGNTGTRTATYNIEEGETVKCTFTNTQSCPCAWSDMSCSATGILRGIWASAPNDLFAVGDNGTIRHYNGAAWSAMTSGTTQSLTSVWGSSAGNVFAVGLGGTILQYNGATWSAMSSGTTQPLGGVWGSGPNDVFAVGLLGTILHYDGATWSAMTSGTTQHLGGVWGSGPDDVFASGGSGTLLHYDGAWSGMTSGTTEHLNGVWGTGPNNVFAVGHNGTILHYEGATWSPMSSGTGQHIGDVWGSGHDDVFAAGGSGTLLHYDGATWSPMSSGTSAHLGGLWGSGHDDVFAVGDAGTVLRYGCSAFPSLDVEKDVSVDDQATWHDADTPPGPEVPAGSETVWFKFVVTNDGDAPLSNVTLTDSDFDAEITAGCAAPTSLAPGGSFECVIGPFVAVLGQHTNTATATGDYDGQTYRECDAAYYASYSDYGDAPDSFGTLLAGSGARHFLDPDYRLGANVDAELDGQPSPLADGDDLNPVAGPDDEEGITLPPTLYAGAIAALDADGGPSGGKLDAWIDYNGNGLFDHPSEHLWAGTSQTLASGSNPALSFDVPGNAVPGPTYARFRLSKDGGLSPTGPAPEGEVEDYVVKIGQNGTIIIEKETEPGEGSGFPFSQDVDASGSFQLNDGQNKTFSSVAPGQYTITELGPPHGPNPYVLTGLVCVDSDSQGEPSTTNLEERTATINLDPGETVTCTYTNTELGTIVITKETVPAGGKGFWFSQNVDASGDFALDGGESLTHYHVLPGQYTVTEEDPLADPGFYDLMDLVCTDSDARGVASTRDLETRTATINLDPGETVTCTFTNREWGTITIEKETEPAGDPTAFAFSGRLGASLKDGESESLRVPPGRYTVQEAVPAGWDLDRISCSDGNSAGDTATATATYRVHEGEEVTCTFTNIRRATITVEKQTDPAGAAQAFAFSGALGAQLMDDETASRELAPGTYRVTEAVPDGWDLTDIRCDDSDSSGDLASGTATFRATPGEQVTCTFFNTQRATLTVEKQTNPAGAAQAFAFSGALSAQLMDGQTASVEVVPSAYQVSEAVPEDWTLTSILCTDSDSTGDLASGTATFQAGPGEQVTCIFTNTHDDIVHPKGSIVVAKETVPDGDPALFAFEGDAAGAIGDGQRIVVPGLEAGVYTSRELVPDGWLLTGITCDDADSRGDVATATAIFQLQEGETVTCTFTNQKLYRSYLPIALR